MTEALIVKLDDGSDEFNLTDLPDIINNKFVNGEITGFCGFFVETKVANSH